MSVTRFAPSPTGFLHIGHAYAALFASDAAVRGGGRFLLRIEDIDAPSCRAEFEDAIKDDLRWLGIAFEQTVRRQSEHFPDYAAALAQLGESGLLYPCFCTRKEIADEIARAGIAPQATELGPEGPRYPGTCRTLSAGARENRMREGASYALRLDVAKAQRLTGPLAFEETGHGPGGETGTQIARPELLGDVVLARKGLCASYHLAVVVDDAQQGVTLVTRGEDLFAATHIQRLLQALLKLPAPAYAHHRLILDPAGRKFSKRDKATTLASLRDSGVTPAELRLLASGIIAENISLACAIAPKFSSGFR
jgi:glutamyl-Q tRNA(Asp) synthetase